MDTSALYVKFRKVKPTKDNYMSLQHIHGTRERSFKAKKRVGWGKGGAGEGW